MTPMTLPPFPPFPIRGVRARYVRQAGCPSDFADVTVDFEPWEDGLVFEVADGAEVAGGPAGSDLMVYHKAFVAGVREELAARAADVAVAVVVHRTAVHDVDSHERAFHAAGRVAVREAFARIDGPPRRPKRRRAGMA
ncbi:hypothetical protein KV557_28655 [Kitasatospora aureofaciens]|uniref:hypothetical protein n=1 Tax=Kitasatospora aureofaciens TaxID=1894 RepID=UPI001C454B56|nr:hypothetical protein [Kitasatospora aureofaciens]MBV6701032.1 hypothetical protein [Kitasatospora aureofaciens]